MRIKVDKMNDTLYFKIDESKIVDSEEIQPGVILDFDNNNNVVGLEILGISGKVADNVLKSLQFETV